MARLYAHKANRCNFSVTHVALRRPAVGDTWCTLHMGQLAPLSQSFALVTGHTRSTSTPCKPNTQDGAIVRMEVSSADGGGQGPGGPWWGNVAVIGDSRCTLTYRPTGAALAVFCACYGVNMIHSNPLQVQHAKRRDSSHGSFIAGVWWRPGRVAVDSRCTLYISAGRRRPRGLLRLLRGTYDPDQPHASPTREAARLFAWKLHSGWWRPMRVRGARASEKG